MGPHRPIGPPNAGRTGKRSMNEFIPFLQRPGAPLNGVPAAAQDPSQQPVTQPAQPSCAPARAPLPQQSTWTGAQGAPTTEDASTRLRHLEPPRYPARIAVYDDMIAPPRVVVIDPCDITDYLTQITQTVYQLMTEQGGDLPHMVIRELVENFIHASFIEPTISILDKGQTLVFSDQGPGIANKAAALKPSFSTATSEMKYYIRGVGSGLPMVESYLKTRHGTMKIDDNLDHGTIVTVSFAHAQAAQEQPQPMQQTAYSQAVTPMPQAQTAGYYQQPAQVQGYAQAWGGYPQQGAWGAPAPQPAWGYPQQAYPGYAQPYGAYPQQAAGAYGQPVPAGAYGQSQQPFAAPVTPVQGMSAQPAGTPTTAPVPGPAALDPKHAQVLVAFAATGQVGGKELAETLGLSAPTASRRLKDLEAQGLAVKNGQKYELTPLGAQELARLTSEDA